VVTVEAVGVVVVVAVVVRITQAMERVVKAAASTSVVVVVVVVVVGAVCDCRYCDRGCCDRGGSGELEREGIIAAATTEVKLTLLVPLCYSIRVEGQGGGRQCLPKIYAYPRARKT